jgi:murein DD-endopeptidase MepM/ murein hydrolase activator NlpD
MPANPLIDRELIESLFFSHYLRTGHMGDIDDALAACERKFNPYHDTDDGRFTFKPGGGSLVPRSRNLAADRLSGGPISRPSDVSDPIGAIIWDSQNPKSRTSAPNPRPLRPRTSESASPRRILSNWPIAGASFDSLNRADKRGEGEPNYGPRGTRRFHRGIDIKAPAGTPVRSASAGQIVHITPNPSRTFGYQVLIYHGHGIYTQYAHLQPGSIVVRSGQRIVAGEQIARVGRTGNVPSTGDAHLHFEVRIGSGAPTVAGGHTGNPLDYLPK